MDFLRLYQHLLPDGRAWRTTVNKRLRQFFQGLTVIPEDVKQSADSVWGDLIPESTDGLDEWERQFGLPSLTQGDAARRSRLAATWRALTGGQSPRYIQDTLQGAGFDVYVHEWWEPSTPPTPGSPGNPTARNPLLWLRRSSLQSKFQVTAGNPAATCGNPAATCGRFDEYAEVQKDYIIPTDPTKWPYFLYIGGEEFGELATVGPGRKNEFEELCLKICPTQQWIGIIVSYS